MKPEDMLAGKYRLEHLLGSGGMAEVWAAVNESTGRRFAVKLMHSSTPELRVRMLREARAGGALKHKNIVDTYDVGETESGDPFLVIELLSGETLADRLARERTLAPATAVEIAGSIAAALRVAHAGGIVHRDLKPANVFLHREPESDVEIVKVLDFGVSKDLRDSTGTVSGFVGTPAYMSPEQAAEEHIDGRSDLWSLGVVLFQMLAGHRPFRASSAYMIISEVVSGPIPSIAEAVPGLGPGLVSVVQRCLTRDVDARVGSADELIRLLGSLDRSNEDDPTSKLVVAPTGDEPTRKFVAASLEIDRTSSDAPTGELVAGSREDARRSQLGAVPWSAGEAPATLTATSRLLPGSLTRRAPSNAVVALVAGAAAVLLLGGFGAALRREPATAPRATSAAEPTEPPMATDVVVASTPRPAVEVAAEAPATAEPAALPGLGKDDAPVVGNAPTATSASADGPRIAAPVRSTRPRAPGRTHPGGEKRLVLP